ncbi:hypothetical protein D9M70_465090 [compost metagenome]
MQLHQEVRADGNIECFGRMRHLQPRCNAADAGDVDLDDRAGALLHVFAEMPDRIHGLTNRDRRRRRTRQADVAVEIISWQRLLDPGEIQFLQARRPADGLVDGKALIAVGHDLEAVAERLAHGGKPIVVLRPVRLADLHLRTGEALGLGGECILDERLLLDMQPAALGRVKRAIVLGAAGELPERQLLLFGA